MISLLALCVAPALSGMAEEPLVPATRYAKTVVVELRYAGTNNVTGKALYKPDAPALLRKGTAERLANVEAYLEPLSYRLKIWDAYRPPSAQLELKGAEPTGEYVAVDIERHALHTWGVAVDATLVDREGKPVPMPTDFDVFSREAWIGFANRSPEVKRNLRVLQVAMGKAGFLGVRNEWWHFVDADWRKYGPVKPAVEAVAVAPPGKPN